MRRVSSRRAAVPLALVILSCCSHPGWACTTCGCTLNADSVLGYGITRGWRVGLEYDYIDQDELRSDGHAARAAQVVNQPSDPSLAGGEIEHDTRTQTVTLAIDYSPSSLWNLGLRLPYLQREHSTYGEQTMPYVPAETAPGQLSTARFGALGDAKALISYQGLLSTRELGVQWGLKLPTARYGDAVRFDRGPASGEAMDASLQPGTGSTDVIVGAYYYHAVSRALDLFLSGQLQSALLHAQRTPGNDFRPGNALSASAGIRLELDPAWVPQLQLNWLHKSADQGALADRPDSAGTVAYLSPGMTLRLRTNLYGYGFVQLPVYSRLDGYQLFPHGTASLGVSYAW